MTLERKVVVITGASRGIGAQLSEAYRQIGYQVIASSRSMRKSDDPAILAIEGDISLPETAERILGIAAERFGRIDTLVNNAGIFIAKPFTEYSEKDFATMIAVNLAGFFHLSQKVRSGGCIEPRDAGRHADADYGEGNVGAIAPAPMQLNGSILD
jgi:NAD(P)-dependent dehydrogenase (short-subunit alcohol dehydrogenase family)